jgi:hypothetical protein
MATEKEANLARDQHADTLAELGAHSIGVDEFEFEGKKTFGVVAFVEKSTAGLPTHLTIRSGKKETQVPLLAKIASPFKPE